MHIKQQNTFQTLILRLYAGCRLDQNVLLVEKMKKVNKQCLLDTPRTVRVSEKTWQNIAQTRRP